MASGHFTTSHERVIIIHSVGRSSNSDWLPTASEGWGKVIFSLCVSVHTRGVPQPGPEGGGTPIQPWTGGTPSSLGWGLPSSSLGRGGPHLDEGTPCPEMGVPPIQGWMGVPPVWTWTGDGVPPPPIRTTEGVLAVQQSVCLLRSCRRTSWFVNSFIMVAYEKIFLIVLLGYLWDSDWTNWKIFL